MAARSGFWTQLVALVKKNFYVKKKNRSAALQEFLLPILFVVLLGLLRLKSTPTRKSEIQRFPSHLIEAVSHAPPSELLVTPDTDFTRTFVGDLISELGETFNGSSFFKTRSDMELYYKRLGTGRVVATGLEFVQVGHRNTKYIVRFSSHSIPDPDNLYGSQGSCRSLDELEYCPGNYYLLSGFINLQLTIDTLLIRRFSNDTNYAKPKLYVEQMPKSAWLQETSGFQVFSSIYFVLAYSFFINYMLIAMVMEKETGVKDVMCVMGLRRSVLWLSWALTYAVIITTVSVVITLLSWGIGLYKHSDMVYIFLLLTLYGYTTIALAFVLTPIFHKAETAGALGSTMTTVISLVYLSVVLTRTDHIGQDGPRSAVPYPVQILMCFLSPIALAMGIDQSLYLDISYGGMRTSNLTYGEFSVATALVMLFVDIFVYVLLALYLDKVIPDRFGKRQPLLFCFKPSYWLGQSKTEVLAPNDLDACHTMDEERSIHIEPVSRELANKNVIRVQSVKKTFTSRKKTVDALKGISMNIYEGQVTAILGHNGAGKSTLLNILVGLVPPTEGSIFVYDMCATDRSNWPDLCSMLGFCPQNNVFIPELTCQQHLELFAAIKNVSPQGMRQTIDRILDEVNLKEKRNVEASKLSGGQKRKLCLAMALIGDPKVLVLDEPTTGLDLVSRRHVWTVLRERRHNRVIILSTQVMDEADIVANRKAFFSKGCLRYIGSSLFLKNRFGLGYHISLLLDPEASPSSITSTLQSCVSSVRLDRSSGSELTYTVPLSDVDRLPDVLDLIESVIQSGSLHIQSYGLSLTTLDEVFMKIGIEEEVDEDCSQTPSSVQQDNTPLDVSDLDCIQKETSLVWMLQFRALFKVRMLHLTRNKSAFVLRVVMPVLFLLLGLIINKYLDPFSSKQNSLDLKASYYLNTSVSRNNPDLVSVLSVNQESLMRHIEEQDVSTSFIPTVTSLLTTEPHHAGLYVHDEGLTVLYNDTATHVLPITLNLLSNAFMALSGGESGSAVIEVVSNPWPDQDIRISVSNYAATFFIGMALINVPLSLAMLLIRERERHITAQLRLSGVSSLVFWLSTFCSDVLQLMALAVCAVALILAFQIQHLITSGALLCLCLMYTLYLPLNLILAYALSFAFKKYETAQNILYNGFCFASMIPFFAVVVLDSKDLSHIATVVHAVFCVVDPPYVFIAVLDYITKVYIKYSIYYGLNASIPISEYFVWDNNISIIYIPPLISIPCLIVLIRHLERKQTEDSSLLWSLLRPDRKKPYIVNSANRQQGDSDVKEEKDRVDKLVNEQQMSLAAGHSNRPTPAVILHNISKVYPVHPKLCTQCSTHCEYDMKQAVHNVSVCVERGEVFGLLGPNGAGKTTTMNMITAQTIPSGGQVIVEGVPVDCCVPCSEIGFCGQQDALYNDLTLREHLHLYMSVRGYKSPTTEVLLNYFSELLQLGPHLNKTVATLSGGTKRKISYCIAVIGNPSVVLLDEPTTGLDPKSKQRLWSTIRQTFSQTDKSAILTTHYMEEADTLCTRIAIMVGGKIVCLGSTQHLKEKYGSGYVLEVKVSEAASTDAKEIVHRYVTELIPAAQRAEHFNNIITYNISQSDIDSVAKIYRALQNDKEALHIEEYSFSQSTLEQVFLKFAREQIDDQATDDVTNRSRSCSPLLEVQESTL